MVEFKTLSSEDIKFGKNNFVEVARKVAVSDEGENEFVSLSRGFFTEEVVAAPPTLEIEPNPE